MLVHELIEVNILLSRIRLVVLAIAPFHLFIVTFMKMTHTFSSPFIDSSITLETLDYHLF